LSDEAHLIAMSAYSDANDIDGVQQVFSLARSEGQPRVKLYASAVLVSMHVFVVGCAACTCPITRHLVHARDVVRRVCCDAHRHHTQMFGINGLREQSDSAFDEALRLGFERAQDLVSVIDACAQMMSRCGIVHCACVQVRARTHLHTLRACDLAVRTPAARDEASARRALSLFDDMTRRKLQPDHTTLVAVMGACACGRA
jgi:hypothetical protein